MSRLNDLPQLPIQHSNIALEKESKKYFEAQLPIEWIITTPSQDFGIDLNIGIVKNRQVTGLKFSVQLKAKQDCKGKPFAVLKKTTLNYLFNGIEPSLIVLYDKKSGKGYWKWLLRNNFDLSDARKSYRINFTDENEFTHTFSETIINDVQKIFLTKNQLLTSLEYDLINGSSELEVKAWSHYIAKNYSEAAFVFKRLIQNEKRAIWFLVLAQSLYQNYEYEEALYFINQAIQLDKNDNIFQAKGCILAEDGIKTQDFYKLTEAENIFSQLYAKENSAINCFNLANTSYHLKRYEDSEKLYKECLTKNNTSAEAWRNLGQIYNDLAQHDNALNCFNNALKLNPTLPQAIVSKGITLGRDFKKYKQAIKLLEGIIEINPTVSIKHPNVFYWISFFYSKIKEFDESLKWAERGLISFPGDFFLRRQKGSLLIYFMNKTDIHLDNSIKYFNDNALHNPHDEVNYFFLCKALSLKGDQQALTTKIKEWYLNKLPGLKDRTKLVHAYGTEILINPIKNWSLIKAYIDFNDRASLMSKIPEHKINVSSSEFLDAIDFARVILLSEIEEEFQKAGEISRLAKSITEIIDRLTELFNFDLFDEMITSSKEDMKSLSKELSAMAVTATDLWYTELYKCIGCALGVNKNISTDELFKHLDVKDIFQKILFRFLKILYLRYDLAM